MRNDSVINRVLHVTHNALFLQCVYSYRHWQNPNNFSPLHNCPPMGRMSIKERGRFVGLNESQTSFRQI